MSLVISSTTDDQAAVNAAAGIEEEAPETTQAPEAARPPKPPEPIEVPDEEEEDEEGEEQETEEGEPQALKREAAKAKKLGGWQRKIAKLEEANSYAYRKLAQLEDQLKPKQQEQPQGPPPRPKLEDFPDNYDAYIEALSDWKTDQKLAAREQENLKKAREWQQQEAARATQQTWQTRTQEFRSKVKDFDAVLEAADDIELHPAIQQSLLNYEKGPQLAYELARNRSALERIAALPNPLDALRELGRFEASLTGAPPRIETRKPFTAPPEPIRPVGKGSNGNVQIPLDQRPLREYINIRNQQEKARKAAR